ncbi:unnamed protein product [Adineta ricciae]|uniref:HAT C-terminal dimerisation domain-containing protein n=1 Tax=Adineta ricciae TaxID=249248 RepID=A0A815T3P1_ADIRI|nr:unnamed protein product [Adineta ricciae]
MFSSIKTLVAHIRRSHRQSKLPTKVQSYSDTRFNGAFIMLQSFLNVFYELGQVLEREHLMEYATIDEVIEELSYSKRPTMHRVIPLRQHLIDCCDPHVDDQSGLEKLKIYLKDKLQSSWPVENEHFLCTVLHSNLKRFGGNLQLQKQAIALLETSISVADRVCTDSVIDSSSLSSSSSTFISKQRNILSKCVERKTFVTTPHNEIKQWMDNDVQLAEGDDDILGFWSNYAKRYPTIAAIAMKVLAIPASNTTVERLFSSTKITMTDRRTRLGAQKVRYLIFQEYSTTY